MAHSKSRTRRNAVLVSLVGGASLAASAVVGATSAAASTAAYGVARCSAAQLTGQVGGDRTVGTAGRDFTIMELVNSSDTTCFVRGYPSVRIYDSTRVSAPSRPRKTTNGETPATVVLAPGAIAEFEIHDHYTADPTCQGDLNGTVTIKLPHTGRLTVNYYWYSACGISVTAVHPERQYL